VAVSVKPELGKRYIEKWIGSQNPDIRWIMKNNLKKKRLIKMDEAWVKAQLSVID
jgi:hypothetical protein